jgi:CRP-like cAMP-binding protein
MSEPQETTFGNGQQLFRQGEKGGELYFIKSGKVELTVRNDATGESAVVAVVGDKSVLGTMSFLEGDLRSATAKCVT